MEKLNWMKTHIPNDNQIHNKEFDNSVNEKTRLIEQTRKANLNSKKYYKKNMIYKLNH